GERRTNRADVLAAVVHDEEIEPAAGMEPEHLLQGRGRHGPAAVGRDDEHRVVAAYQPLLGDLERDRAAQRAERGHAPTLRPAWDAATVWGMATAENRRPQESPPADEVTTISGLPVEPLYRPEDADVDY